MTWKPRPNREKVYIWLRLGRAAATALVWVAQGLQMGSGNTLKNALRLANSRD